MSQQPPVDPQQPGYGMQGPPGGAPPPFVQQAPQGYYPQPAYGVSPPGNGLAVAGMVCGIVSIVFVWFWPLAIILGTLGLIFGFIGNSRAARIGGRGKGMAIAGIVCGAIGIVLSILLIVLFAIAIHNAVTTLPNFTFSPTST